MLEASIKKVGLNEDFMPFGRMKREILLDARRILTDIRYDHLLFFWHFTG